MMSSTEVDVSRSRIGRDARSHVEPEAQRGARDPGSALIYDDELQHLLREGLSTGLYSGAAAGISTPFGRGLASAGTHALDDPTPVTQDSQFDLASLTKTFTAAAIVKLAEQGVLDLDDPVASILPIGHGRGAERITLRMLLTHVSGLPAESFVWKDATVPADQRVQRVITSALESAPDADFRYSCVGYISAGAVAEQITGRSLAQLISELITEPLGLSSVEFGPVDPRRAVATEEKPWVGRGTVRGEVHDELNNYLGGRAGNAGLFGSARDILSFAESFLDGRLLDSASLAEVTANGLRPSHGAGFGHGLGPRIDDPDFFGKAHGFGHIGFTGTLWFADPRTGLAAALLTNNVHPHRDHADLKPFRHRFMDWATSLAAGAADGR